MELNGVAAIVTGASSGLGKATAIRLAERGARVSVFDRDGALAAAVAREIDGHFAEVDVTQEEALSDAVQCAERKHGVARILLCAAGISPSRKVIDRNLVPHPMTEFRRTLDVNVAGTFACIAQVASRIAAAEPIGEENGVLISVASIAAFEGTIGSVAYSASKAAVAGMTLPIARELAPHGIRMVSIAPGLFHTPMMGSFSETAQSSMLSQVVFPPRLGEGREFAGFVEEIIENSMLNGDTIRLDGAVRLRAK